MVNDFRHAIDVRSYAQQSEIHRLDQERGERIAAAGREHEIAAQK